MVPKRVMRRARARAEIGDDPVICGRPSHCDGGQPLAACGSPRLGVSLPPVETDSSNLNLKFMVMLRCLRQILMVYLVLHLLKEHGF